MSNYSSAASSVPSTCVPEIREGWKREKDRKFERDIDLSELDKELEKDAYKNCRKHVEKRRKFWKKEFEKIPKTSKTESLVHKPFHNFFKKLCDSQSDLQVEETKDKPLKNLPGINAKKYDKKPDLTILHRAQNVVCNVYALMHVEVKKNLDESLDERYKYYEGYNQLYEHAVELFLREGAFVPRRNTLGLLSDGKHFHLFVFFEKEGLVKHLELCFTRAEALETLIKIAHYYLYNKFELPIYEVIEPCYDLFHDTSVCERISQSEISCVYVIYDKVLKVNGLSMYKTCIDNEIEIYKKLNSHTLSKNLPILTVVGTHNSETKSALLFQERGTRLQIINGMHKVVQVLQVLHSMKIVHRDIRPANLIRISRNAIEEIILIDFGFACSSEISSTYFGTWETASDRILQELQKSDEFTVTSADDLESILKTMVLLLFSEKIYWSKIRDLLQNRHSQGKERAKNILEIWIAVKNSAVVKGIFGELWEAAENVNYQKLVKGMKAIEEQTVLPDCLSEFKKPTFKPTLKRLYSEIS